MTAFKISSSVRTKNRRCKRPSKKRDWVENTTNIYDGMVYTGGSRRRVFRYSPLSMKSCTDGDPTSFTISSSRQSRLGLGFLFAAACLGLIVARLGFAGTILAANDILITPAIAPDAPVIAQITASGNKQLHVVWDEPAESGSSPIEYYAVQWRTTVEGYDYYYDRVNRSLQTEGKSVTITDLLGPNDLHGHSPQYQIRVRAVNGSGPGEWSSEKLAATITVPLAPSGLRLERTGSGNQIQVNWNEPAAYGDSPPDEYIIQYQWASRSNWHTRHARQVSGTQTTFITEALEVGVTWRFRVVAVNAAGTGNWTGAQKLRLYAQPNPPSDINVIPGFGRLTVEWQLPSGDSNITGSRLRWRPTGGADSDWTIVELSPTYELAYTIVGLTNGQSYDLEVAVYNPSQTSEWTSAPVGIPLIQAAAPTDLEMSRRRYNRVDVRWEWQDNNSYPITGFIVRWRHSSETEFQTENQATVDSNDRWHGFYNVPHARSYIVEVIALGVDGEEYGSIVIAGHTNSASVIIFEYFREEYEDDEPWIGDVIDSRKFRIASNGSPGYWAYVGMWRNGWSLSRTVGLGFSPGVLNGAAYRLGQPVQTVLHELMHAWTYDWPAVENPGPLGVMWLYMNTQLTGRCNGGEILADTLIYPVQRSQKIRYSSAYYRSCRAVGRTPTPEATEIARNALNGEFPQWFYDTYQSDSGSMDMEQLWYDLRNPEYDQYRYGPRGYLFREMFGGFCSYEEAYQSYRSDRDSDAVTTNPWRDGGCVSYRPMITEVEAGSNALLSPNIQGEVHLSWDKPLWTKEPAVNGYLVQWKIAGRNNYNDSRQILIEGLDATDLLILGLKSNTAYTIRVAAVDTSNPGLLISRYGHKRYAETVITAPYIPRAFSSAGATHTHSTGSN